MVDSSKKLKLENISIEGDENDPWRPETIHTIRGFFLFFISIQFVVLFIPRFIHISYFLSHPTLHFSLISAQAYAYHQTGIPSLFLMFLYLCYISLNSKPLLSINSFLGYFWREQYHIISWFKHVNGLCSKSYSKLPSIPRLIFNATNILFIQDQ